MARPLFVFIINAALTESLAAGAALFRDRRGPVLDVRMFGTHDIEEETVSARTVAESLEAADMVFLDIRGGGAQFPVHPANDRPHRNRRVPAARGQAQTRAELGPDDAVLAARRAGKLQVAAG